MGIVERHMARADRGAIKVGAWVLVLTPPLWFAMTDDFAWWEPCDCRWEGARWPDEASARDEGRRHGELVLAGVEDFSEPP